MDIVEELRKDREGGAKRLESEYKAGLLTLARRFCADEGDAEELVNRTLAIVVERIDDYIEQSAFFGWMCRIMSNCHHTETRRKSNQTVLASAGAEEDATDEDAAFRIFREVDASLLRDAVETLPAELREAVVLRYFTGLSVAQIARFVAIPAGTVKSRLHYARLALAEKLGAVARKPGVRILFLGLMLAAGLAVAGGIARLAIPAVVGARSAEDGSHAEVAAAGNAGEAAPPPFEEGCFRTSNTEPSSLSTYSTISTIQTIPTISTIQTIPTIPTIPTMKPSSLLAATASFALAAAPADVSAGWVYSVPDGNQWWDQGILEWTDSSGFHNVISNIARNAFDGHQLRIAKEGGKNPLALNLDFSVGIEGGYELVSIGGGTLGGTPVTNFVAPSTLKAIDWGAFEQNRNLRSVVLNEGLETLAMNAFNGCTSLESFSGLPSTLTSMGGGVFSGAQKLSGEIVWPAGVSSCNQVFPNTSISSFIATNGLRSIDGYAAFGGCANLSKIVLGPDFEYAGRRAFGDNSSTKVDMHVYFNNFPSRGFSSSLIDGGKRHAVTFHMEWSARDEWNAWMSTNTVFVTDPPASPYAKGDLEKGSWTDWNMRVWLMWWHVPVASVGGTDYTSLRAAMAAAADSPITLLAPSVADFTDERVSLDKNESLVVVDDGEHVLGYLPGVPDVPGWELVRSCQTWDGTAVIVYKAVGPGTLILVK